MIEAPERYDGLLLVMLLKNCWGEYEKIMVAAREKKDELARKSCFAARTKII